MKAPNQYTLEDRARWFADHRNDPPTAAIAAFVRNLGVRDPTTAASSTVACMPVTPCDSLTSLPPSKPGSRGRSRCVSDAAIGRPVPDSPFRRRRKRRRDRAASLAREIPHAPFAEAIPSTPASLRCDGRR
jgi:hypothetical protein